ncbi:MAG TPA: exosortase/archaeosortase family protein [Acidimicrobiia bacterium]|nr:exosortase/archaeosortase family protein [Acidimicrobiia bacterium]HEV3451516.1 exosortase/archaeosortase family protein [Acidimicrobiia bacterium]
MNRRMLTVLLRLALAFGATFGLFWLLVDPARDVEATAVSTVFRSLGFERASQSFGHQILVLPPHSAPFLATISTSCSALAAVLGFAAITVFVVGGSVARRLLAFLAAGTLVVACNFVRIGLSTYVGMRSGAQSLTVFHDWVGTAFGLLYVLGGFTLYLWVLLPSNRVLLRESGHGG